MNCDNCGKEFEKHSLNRIVIYDDINYKVHVKDYCDKCHSLFIERLDETL